MINTPFLSIIIPVYNVESYLAQCLDSIISCTFSSYELILVIGDSSDQSNLICDDYACRYSQVSIRKQDGTGLSDARNCGVRIAQGEYIMFVDSDDYILTAAFDKTISAFFSMKNKAYDILVSDFSLVNGKNKIYSQRNQIRESEAIIEDCTYLKHFLMSKGNYWNVWRYIYRREFIMANQLIFKENYKSEDIDYSTKVLLASKQCCFYHNPYYCYRVRREGSLVNDIKMQNVDDLMDILDESIHNILKCPDFPYTSIIINKLLIEYLFSFLLIRDIAPGEAAATCQKIKSKMHLLKATPRGRFLHFVISILGIRFIAWLLYLLRASRRRVLKIR